MQARRLALFRIALLALALPGCDTNRARREQLQSLYPLDRARAAVQLAHAGDPQAVQALVDLLEDDDRGVRLYTIVSLEKLTGQTHGYLYYASESDRSAAVERWRDAVRRGVVTLRPLSVPGPLESTASAGG